MRSPLLAFDLGIIQNSHQPALLCGREVSRRGLNRSQTPQNGNGVFWSTKVMSATVLFNADIINRLEVYDPG